MNKNRASRSTKTRQRRALSRIPRVENLENRRLLNVDWRNPIDHLDVSNDLYLSPLDALLVINELNTRGSGPLPDHRETGNPFLDANGDQSVTPWDALMVINYLNDHGEMNRSLAEHSLFASQQEIDITVGQGEGSRLYRMQLDADFGASTGETLVTDLFSVYLADPSNLSRTILDRGVNGTSPVGLSAIISLPIGCRPEPSAGLGSGTFSPAQ